MQSLTASHPPPICKDQNPLLRDEIFKSTKILFSRPPEDSPQTSLDDFEVSSDVRDYGPIHDQFPRSESLSPKPGPKTSSKAPCESYKNSLKREDNFPGQKNQSFSRTHPLKSNVLKEMPDGGSGTGTGSGSGRSDKCFYRAKKVGDIISTSRSGHLIERRGEGGSRKVNASDSGQGCDSNDNIIEPKVTAGDMHDINDNPDDGGIPFQEEETSLSDNAKSGTSDCEAPCGIGILERLIRSHAVWFLPGIQRAGAVHLLQGKEEGNFIVRQSSQPDTMAVSVRLPAGKGPYIEHYLIQAVEGQLSLESSENLFESIPSLIAHYCQCCDELPVQLTLPRTIREARNRQQLSSLALLGQEFWRYPMANPRPPESRNSSPSSTKSDSLSSFEGVKKAFKQNHEIILDLVPIHQDSQPSSMLSTFKSSPNEGGPSSLDEEAKPKRPHTLDLICTNTTVASFSEKTGLVGNKTPPQPPPRWTKPSSSIISKQFSSFISTTVTTVVSSSSSSKINQPVPSEEEALKREFNDCSSFTPPTYPPMTSNPPPLHFDRNISSPQSDQTNLKSFDFEREKNSLKHFQEGKGTELISPVSDNTGFTSKCFEKVERSQSTASTPTEKPESMFKRYKKETKHKGSSHYQECDLLESPTLYYYKSNVADKQSDYEDIWATESFTTFKPLSPSSGEPEARKSEDKHELKKPPDLLDKLDNQFKVSFTEKRDDKTLDLKSSEVHFDPKQNSPFYAEPLDALVVRRKTRSSFNRSRHSDPFSFNNNSPVGMNPYLSGGNVLGRIDSQNEMSDDLSCKAKASLSFDNIINLKRKEAEGKSKVNPKAKNFVKAKPVRPPKVDNAASEKTHQNWAVDSSWEFIGKEEGEREVERKFPSLEQQMDSEETAYKYTVQEIISQRFPHFKISRGFGGKSLSNRDHHPFSTHLTPFPKPESSKSGSRISAYDNLSNDRFAFFKSGNDSEVNSGPSAIYGDHRRDFTDSLRSRRRIECGSVTEDNEDAQTIFSEPWDSSRWENLLPSNVGEPCFETNGTAPRTENGDDSFESFPTKMSKEGNDVGLSSPFLKLKSKELSTTGASIRSYALHLASDKSTTFAQNIDNFIQCTLESRETSPQVVMRNMRQFMSGMKNYLVKHGEREFEKQVEKERMKLKSTEFLNLDAILEGVMHKLVVRPLRSHLYKLFVDEYIKNGAIQLLYENLNYARTKSLHDLGLKLKIAPPQEALEAICHIILRLQEVDSPLEKLDHLLACVSTIIHSLKPSSQDKTNAAPGTDDILPLFVWVLVQSGFIAAEIEAEYMWGLLHPSLLSGEGCYYLTTLSSAVHVLKNLKSCDLDQSNRSAVNECGNLKSVLKIIVPDELHGSILTKTLPVKPNMTTKDVCKIIAHKIRITNPQDYGLFRLVDGEETLLNDTECPQNVKSELLESGKHCTLAYKRIDAKIGWPRTA